ncbi:hypothetical protein BGZ80_008647 [Entomortierella chlamydospora]|uniref:SPX domain-containing protein n=1 Tax=Entomortierella chlamydospora TaxID=101097 RepID=A0A9P6MY55_9FUNG|nr:hypothetical protein BGZ79_003826 [Entomortierella chlamydospora]KAG0017061.1 hypothetical protein BGZ80_008647 [Entomortierella chlamydospora]
MKFAKQLGLRSIPSWAPYYLDYKSLKGYIKTSFKGLAGPLESLESVDHEGQEHCSQMETNGAEPKITISEPPESSDSGPITSDQEASKEKNASDDAAYEASVNIAVEGFKALLWAELEKVNARYEAQERVAGVNLERLNASYLLEFSQTNITGFKKIIKKFDKHYRGCQSTSQLSSSASSTPLSEQGNDGTDSANTITYPAPTAVDPDAPSTLSMFSNLSIHGRGTPTIYLPNGYLEPASSLQPQEPLIRNMSSPGSSKSVFYHNYYGGVSALSLELWKMVIERTFAKSEKDERLLTEARALWRKRTPVVPEHVSPLLLNVDPKDYPVWDDLDLESLPSGRLTRLWIVLAESAMSTPIKVPVLVAKGVRPGPVVGLTAALHGNELNGIPLTHRLVLHEIQCQALHGIVVAVPVANVPGYLAGQRGFSDGTDLNRLMPGKKDGSTSQVYSYNLMTRIIRHFTHLIDLHTASKGRVNSLYVRANMQNSTTRHMARLQNPQIIVHNTSPDGSLRGAAMQQYNIPAITVEIGDPSRFQKRFVKNAILGVTNILSHLKMIEDDHEVQDYEPVVCAKSYWIFTKGGGILNVLPDVNTWVRKGELIATLHNIFGEEEHRYFAPEDGVVVGKSVDPVCQSGCRILHLGVVSDRFPEGKIDDGHQ